MRGRSGSGDDDQDRRGLAGTAATGIAAGGAVVALVLAIFGGKAISAQDKYTVQVPNGLAFAEFRGFEDWQTVAVSQSGDLIEVILANPLMIDAAQFDYDAQSDTFKPEGTGADCGYACHTIVVKKDYVFTAYGKR